MRSAKCGWQIIDERDPSLVIVYDRREWGYGVRYFTSWESAVTDANLRMDEEFAHQFGVGQSYARSWRKKLGHLESWCQPCSVPVLATVRQRAAKMSDNPGEDTECIVVERKGRRDTNEIAAASTFHAWLTVESGGHVLAN